MDRHDLVVIGAGVGGLGARAGRLHRGSPGDVCTDPELGSVGLTEGKARRRGMAVRVGALRIADSDRGWLYGRGADAGLLEGVADTVSGTFGGRVRAGPGGR